MKYHANKTFFIWAGLIFPVVCTTVAKAETLTFDGGPEVGEIASTYAPLGVTFANAKLISNGVGVDYHNSQATPSLSITAASSNGLNSAADPIIATFASPQPSISILAVNVGAAGAKIVAYDALEGGTVVSSAEAHGLTASGELVNNGVLQAEEFLLQVIGPGIRRIELFRPNPDATDAIQFDNLSFQPPPGPGICVTSPVDSSQATTAAIFTTWQSFDNANNLLKGVIGKVNVTLSGYDLTTAILDQSYTQFNAPYFIPPLPYADLIEITGSTPARTYRLEFSQPVTNPVLYLATFASAITFNGIQPVKLSGESVFVAQGHSVTGVLNNWPSGHDANGAVMLPGTHTVIDFSVAYSASSVDGIDIAVAAPLNFAINSLSGASAAINPLPMAGQGSEITGIVTNTTAEELPWQLTVGDRVIQTGSGGMIQAKWDGRNAEGEIIPGTYEVVLSAGPAGAACQVEKHLQVNVTWDDNCKLDITYSPSP